MNNEKFEPIRLRIMKEAYNLADRGDTEGYNAIKVMCDEVQNMLQREWVGLTKAEFEEAVEDKEDLEDCWMAIEAKLQEKNI